MSQWSSAKRNVFSPPCSASDGTSNANPALIKFFSVPGGLMWSLLFTTKMRLALRCSREFPNTLDSNRKICDSSRGTLFPFRKGTATLK